MSDASFEVKFGQLVDNLLKEKAPSLLEYRVGFQTLDKNDEETMAVGISVFVLNGLWLYQPSFFIKGKLKGTDLLYVKQNDIFVPTRDNWITSFKEQGKAILGESLDDKTEEGEEPSSPGDVLTEDEDEITDKVAAEDPYELQITVDKMCKRIEGSPMSSFTEKLAGLGTTAQLTYAKTLTNSPEFANACFTYYSPKELRDMATQLTDAFQKKAAVEKVDTETVEIIVDPTSDKAKELSDPEKKILTREGIFAKDERQNFSRIFHDKVKVNEYFHPNTSGLYEVLLADGSWKGCLYFMAEDFGNTPIGYAGNSPAYSSGKTLISDRKNGFLVFLDNTDKAFDMSCEEVVCRNPQKDVINQFKGIRGGRKATPSSITSLLNSLKNKEDNRDAYRPSNLIICQGTDRCYNIPIPYDDSKLMLSDGLLKTRSNKNVYFTGKDGKMSVVKGVLFVPNTARVFRIAGYDESKDLSFGDMSMVLNKIMKEASVQPISIYSSGQGAQVCIGQHNTGYMDKIASFKYLAENVGIYAGQAKQLLKEAARSTDHKTRYFIKLAAPYDEKYNTPPSVGTRQETGGVVETTSSPKLNAKEPGVLPEQAINKAVDISQTGIKEVFDASVLESLINVADLSELRQDYIKDMIKGMDRIGRMLFLFYWHNEEFENRYGEEDMTKLEDTLRQVFSSTGDLVLFLKEKVAYSPDTSENIMGSLSEDIGESDF